MWRLVGRTVKRPAGLTDPLPARLPRCPGCPGTGRFRPVHAHEGPVIHWPGSTTWACSSAGGGCGRASGNSSRARPSVRWMSARPPREVADAVAENVGRARTGRPRVEEVGRRGSEVRRGYARTVHPKRPSPKLPSRGGMMKRYRILAPWGSRPSPRSWRLPAPALRAGMAVAFARRTEWTPAPRRG